MSDNRTAVSIPIDSSGNKIYVPFRINGREPSSFALDTGAPGWLIELEHARSLGLPLTDPQYVQCVGASAVSNSPAYLIAGLSMSLPGVELRNQTAVALAMSEVKAAYPSLQGIAGRSFLQRLVVRFDFVNQLMHLYQPAAHQYRGSGTILPIRMRSGLPFIQATLIPLGREPITAHFLLDTGASLAVALNTPFAEKHKLLDGPQKLLPSILGFGVGGPIRGYVGRAEALQLGANSLPAPTIAFATTAEGAHAQEGFAGVIGVDVVRRFHLILDYPQGQIALEKNAWFDAPFEHDMSGVTLTRSNGHFRVRSVVDGSPASAAGLRAGDLVTHVDGQEVGGIHLGQLRLSLRQAGNTHRLRIKRPEERLEVSITLRRLI